METHDGPISFNNSLANLCVLKAIQSWDLNGNVYLLRICMIRWELLQLNLSKEIKVITLLVGCICMLGI